MDEGADGRRVYSSAHYSFSVIPGSAAERDIDSIMGIQEDARRNIIQTFGLKSDLMIEYTFFRDAFGCAEQYRSMNPGAFPGGALYPVNAFAWFPSSVYATYSDEVKAIGHHEDAHLFLFEHFADVSSRFITEGAAVAMDGYWRGTELHAAARALFERGAVSEIGDLFVDAAFDGLDSNVTYPLAGSFCKWLMQTRGVEALKDLYVRCRNGDFAKLKAFGAEYGSFMAGT